MNREGNPHYAGDRARAIQGIVAENSYVWMIRISTCAKERKRRCEKESSKREVPYRVIRDPHRMEIDARTLVWLDVELVADVGRRAGNDMDLHGVMSLDMEPFRESISYRRRRTREGWTNDADFAPVGAGVYGISREGRAVRQTSPDAQALWRRRIVEFPSGEPCDFVERVTQGRLVDAASGSLADEEDDQQPFVPVVAKENDRGVPFDPGLVLTVRRE